MGMELYAEQAGYAEMEIAEITDNDLFKLVRGALKSALQVGCLDTYLRKIVFLYNCIGLGLVVHPLHGKLRLNCMSQSRLNCMTQHKT